MTENSTQVPVLRCLVYAFVFLRRNLAFIYYAGGLYAVASILSTWLRLFFNPSSGAERLGVLSGLLLIPLGITLYAAYLRRGLGMSSHGFLDLRLGADEYRLFLTMLAVGGITLFIVILGGLAGSFALDAVIASVVDPAIIEAEPASAFRHSGMVGVVAAIVIGSAVAVLGLYTLARFSPAYPAVIAEKRVVVFEAAVWSKGQGWRMVLAIVLTSAPFYLVLAPGMVQYAQLIISNALAEGSAETAALENIDLRPLFWFFVLSALLWPASKGVKSGLYTTFYRGLRADKAKS